MGRIIRKTAMIGALTLGSRILGFIRDVLMAFFLGATSHSDAFFLAFRPFDLARKMFSEGMMNVSFIPSFTGVLEKRGPESAGRLVFSFLFLMVVIGLFAVLAGVLWSPWVIRIMAPGLVDQAGIFEMTASLFRIMVPYAFFVLISAVFMGILNAYGSFSIPALTPALFNLVVILAAVFGGLFFSVPAVILAMGVTVAGFLQLAVQLPYVFRTGVLNRSSVCFFHPEVIRIILIMIPSMAGAAAYQLNIMVAAVFASNLDEGSVSYLYFADRLVQFPLALFAVSLATVLLPEISGKALKGRTDEIAGLFSNGIRLVLFITIPAMAGLMALNEPITRLIFGHGSFDETSIRQTADCLFFLATGLWAFTGMRLLSTLYFSLMKVSVPFYAGMMTVGINLAAGPVLMHWLGLKGLMLAVSLSAAAGVVFLLVRIPGIIQIRKKEIVNSACRSFFLSAIMFLMVRQAAAALLPELEGSLWYAAGVLALTGFGGGLYACMSHLVSHPEMETIKTQIKKAYHDRH